MQILQTIYKIIFLIRFQKDKDKKINNQKFISRLKLVDYDVSDSDDGQCIN